MSAQAQFQFGLRGGFNLTNISEQVEIPEELEGLEMDAKIFIDLLEATKINFRRFFVW